MKKKKILLRSMQSVGFQLALAKLSSPQLIYLSNECFLLVILKIFPAIATTTKSITSKEKKKLREMNEN